MHRYYLVSRLNRLPFNNKSARFGGTPDGGRFEAGMQYEWEEDWSGVYMNNYLSESNENK